MVDSVDMKQWILVLVEVMLNTFKYLNIANQLPNFTEPYLKAYFSNDFGSNLVSSGWSSSNTSAWISLTIFITFITCGFLIPNKYILSGFSPRYANWSVIILAPCCLKRVDRRSCLGVLKDVTECDIGHKGMMTNGVCYGCRFQDGRI